MNNISAEMQQYLDTRTDKAAEARKTAADHAAAKKAAGLNTIELLFLHPDEPKRTAPEADDDPNAILRDIFN